MQTTIIESTVEEYPIIPDYFRFGTLPNDNTVSRREILKSQDYILSKIGVFIIYIALCLCNKPIKQLYINKSPQYAKEMQS